MIARRARESWSPPGSRAIGAGESFDQSMAAALDAGEPVLVARARAIREEGELVPPGLIGRLLSYFAAAADLGLHYPVDRGARPLFEKVLLAWGEQGHDVDWWIQVSRHSFDLDANRPRCSCGLWMRAVTDAA